MVQEQQKLQQNHVQHKRKDEAKCHYIIVTGASVKAHNFTVM